MAPAPHADSAPSPCKSCSLPKPSWLAERAWSTATRSPRGYATRSAWCSATRRRPASTSSPTANRHAGIAMMFLEGLEGVEHRRPCASATATTRTFPSSSGCSASRAARFLRGATERKVKVTPPGPMMMVDTLHACALRSRESWRGRSPRRSQRRGACDRGHRGRRHTVRRTAFNVVFLDEGLGAKTLERRPRPPSTASVWLRDQGQHRLEEDARQRVAAVRRDLSAADVGHPAGLAGNAQTRARRSSSSGSSKARTRGRGDRRRDRPDRNAGTRRRDPLGAALRAAARLYPCTNCGVRCHSPGTWPAASSSAPGGGASRRGLRGCSGGQCGPDGAGIFRAAGCHSGCCRDGAGYGCPSHGVGRWRAPNPVPRPRAAGARGATRVSSAKCFSFKAVSTP